MLSISDLYAKMVEFSITFIGRAIHEALQDPLLTLEVRVQSRVTSFGIRGRLNSNGVVFSQFPLHSTRLSSSSIATI
jgi:hypothetical protein